MKKLIKKILYSNPVTKWLVINGRQLFRWVAFARPCFLTRLLHPNTVFLVLTPEHGNLGDHAIADSIIRFLGDQGIPYREVSGKRLDYLRRKCALDVFNGCPVFFNGGGNLGTLWFDVEVLTRTVISQNPKSPMIIFPNSFFYEDTPWGQEELQNSVEIYNAHPNLTIFAREHISYNGMKDLYRNVRLVPDMVMAMQYHTEAGSRQGALLCMRSDVERTLSAGDSEILLKAMQDHFGDALCRTDTVLPHDVGLENRQQELNRLFARFASSRLVVTDRLHGMVFCAITGTPCILMNSKSPKIRGCYAWLKDLPYIRFAETVEQAVDCLPQLAAMEEQTYDNSFLMPCYEPLREAMAAACKK